MTRDEKIQKLHTLPWQALYDFAIMKNIREEDIKNKDKSEIVHQILCVDVEDEEIEQVIKDYIYGSRVTFSLWKFDEKLQMDHYTFLEKMDGYFQDEINVTGYKRFKIIGVNKYDDRLELIYTYSKKYNYINENGYNDYIWEMHQGCIWIGTEKNYLACISKHEKVMLYVINLIANKLSNHIRHIKPPKSAIEKCTKNSVVSRIVLQGIGGEKTIISNSSGFTTEQEEEVDRIKKDRFDTSGSYIAEIQDRLKATVKYNMNKGNIGIYKHIPADVLFAWSHNTIDIIMNEIEELKGRPAEEIYQEMGCEIKWGTSIEKHKQLNRILTYVINSFEYNEDYRQFISNDMNSILEDDKLFCTIPQVYCSECESYETPFCWNCGEELSYGKNGLLECSCNAPLKYTCSEHHGSCELKNWHVPTYYLKTMLDKNLKKIFDDDLDYQICVMDDEICIANHVDNCSTEIKFSDIDCFKSGLSYDDKIRSYAIRMNEKCSSGCTYSNIEKCIHDSEMNCLPKLFYGIIPDYRPQPHTGYEFGDVSGQVMVGKKQYQMIAVIKKNTENKGTKSSQNKEDSKFINKYLMATAKEGEEIIRQFVQQGMQDARVDIIAVVAPQYFDRGLKGTLNFLAKLINKKVVFIELNQICQLIAMKQNII